MDLFSSQNTLKIGIIGSGSHMIEHLLPALGEIGSNKVVAVSTQTVQTFQLNKHLYPSAVHYSDLGNLIKLEFVDLVIVASNPDVHLKALIACWKINKPIFIEKPVTLNSELIPDELLSSDFAKKLVFVGYNFPHAEIPKLFLSKVESNKSKPSSITVRCFANKPDESIWGLRNCFEAFMFAVGIHAMDFARRLSSNEKLVKVETIHSGSLDHHFHTSSIALNSDGTCLTFNFSNAHTCFFWEIDVQFKNGEMFRLDGTKSIVEMFTKNGNKVGETKTQMSVLGSSRNGYKGEFLSFFNSIRTDTESENSLVNDMFTLDSIKKIINNGKTFNEYK